MKAFVQGSTAENLIPTHRNQITTTLPLHRLCYRPAVFFCHLPFTALSFWQGKTNQPPN
jgi:hypothetical protein